MTPGLLSEIKQKKPFAHASEELFLSLIRTTDLLGRKPSELLKQRKLSPAQYNVLRILRGAEPLGIQCGEIAMRMVTRDPDITRLLDRMQRRKLVTRKRDPKDRRVVTVRITAAGLVLLKGLDQPLVALHQEQLGFLKDKDIQGMLDQLSTIRESLRSSV